MERTGPGIRIADGREERTSFCIIDAQSVKNTDTAEDTQGLPHAIYVTTATVEVANDSACVLNFIP